MERRSQIIAQRIAQNANLAGAQALVGQMSTSRRSITPYINLDTVAPMGADSETFPVEQLPADPEISDKRTDSTARRIGKIMAESARRINKPPLN